MTYLGYDWRGLASNAIGRKCTQGAVLQMSGYATNSSD